VPIRAENIGLDPPRHIIRFGDSAREETLLLGAVEPLGRMVYARRSGRPEIVLATRNLITLLQGHATDFVDPTLLRGLAGPVDLVRIVDPAGTRLDARRTGSRWTLHIPAPVPADDGKLSTLVRTLTFVRHGDVLVSRPTPTELHRLGLPDDDEIARGELHGATRIELGAPGEQPISVWLQAGWEDQQGTQVAARRAGAAKILAVPRITLAMLTNPAGFFRDRHLLPPITERAEALRMERGGEPTLSVRRGKDGRWLFEQPARLLGEAVEAERIAGHSLLGDLLERLDAVEAIGFCEPPGGEPIARLHVEWTRAGSTTTARVELHAPGPDGVPCTSSERPGEGLLVPATVLDYFQPLQADLLRSTRPLAVDAEAWAGFVIERPGGPAYTLVRRTSDGTWDGDDEWVRRLSVGLDMLRGLRGLRWEPARTDAHYDWGVRFLDAQGTLLAGLELRRSEPDEELEVLGIPVVRARVAGRPGVELAVAREWIDRIEALALPPERMQDG
jgi:hypothetical protein